MLVRSRPEAESPTQEMLRDGPFVAVVFPWVVVVMWVVMLLVARGGSRANGAGSLLHDMVTRFMGLIVLAMGVQFALTGFHNFFS